MTTQYPSTLPKPLINGFGMSVSMGVVRADSDTHQVQRRVFTTMPHGISLSFAMSTIEWAQWQAWVTVNGYRWFEIELPTLYAGRLGQVTSPVLIRFTSGVSVSALSGEHVQVSVTAQISPSMIARYLEAVS